MHDLFRQGALHGASPRVAYFSKCDAETTTQSDRNKGIVNILVGFAPLKPAEFVILKISQIAGELEGSASSPAGSTRARTSSSGSSGTAST
jgi:phage tail sheath protein FI